MAWMRSQVRSLSRPPISYLYFTIHGYAADAQSMVMKCVALLSASLTLPQMFFMAACKHMRSGLDREERTRVTVGFFAILLSLFMVSASVSASACDLACWSQQIKSDCHSANSASTSNDEMTMSMPSDMDMGSGGGEGSMGPDTDMSAVPDHSMAMSPQMEMAAEHIKHATASEMETIATHEHPKSESSCVHQTCNQASAAASPPKGDRSQLSPLHRITISASAAVDNPVTFYRGKVGTHPPEILGSDRLVTTLRI